MTSPALPFRSPAFRSALAAEQQWNLVTLGARDASPIAAIGAARHVAAEKL